MLKKILIIFILFLLSGCNQNNNKDLICKTIETINKEKINIETTYYFKNNEIKEGISKLTFTSEYSAQAYYNIYNASWIKETTKVTINKKEVTIKLINIDEELSHKTRKEMKNYLKKQGFKCN